MGECPQRPQAVPLLPRHLFHRHFAASTSCHSREAWAAFSRGWPCWKGFCRREPGSCPSPISLWCPPADQVHGSSALCFLTWKRGPALSQEVPTSSCHVGNRSVRWTRDNIPNGWRLLIAVVQMLPPGPLWLSVGLDIRPEQKGGSKCASKATPRSHCHALPTVLLSETCHQPNQSLGQQTPPAFLSSALSQAQGHRTPFSSRRAAGSRPTEEPRWTR